jgi:O-antigen/teichoic acid export membrane protein
VRVFRGAGVLTVATFIANISNYAFQVVLGRTLGPEDYGLLSGAFTFVALFGTSASSLQAALAKSEARRGGDDELARRLNLKAALNEPVTRWVLIGSTCLALALVVASPLLNGLLNVEDSTAIAVAAILPGTALASVAFGRMQGTRRFNAFALLAVVMAVGKLVGGVVAGVAGFSVPVILLLLALTTTAAALVGAWYTSDSPSVSPRAVLHDSARALIALTFFWLVISVDVPLARHWLPEAAAGRYAAASLIGRAVLWLPAVIAVVVYPQMARLNESTEDARSLVIKSCIATSGICVAACVGLFVTSPLIFSVLFGSGYEQAATLAWQLGLVSLPLAVANVLVYFLLSRQGWWWMPAVVVPLALEVGWLWLAHGSSSDFVLASLASAAVMMVLLGGAVAWTLRSDGPPSGSSRLEGAEEPHS